MKAQDVEEAVRALERADLFALRDIWAERIGAVPKVRSADMLRRVLAWRLQTEAYGGLDKDTRRKLAQVGSKRMMGPLLRPGVRLTREWGGRLHEVEVRDGSFVYAERSFASLSQIASEITGVRWNGPRFFGLRKEAAP